MLILLLLSISIISTSPHNCIHDKITANIKLTPINDSHIRNPRILQQTNSYGPIRFQMIYNNNDFTDNNLKQTIDKIMSILNRFWQKTIEVDYYPSLSYNVLGFQGGSGGVQCFGFDVPQNLIDNPVANKDFGIFVEAKNDSANGVAAYSSPCAYSTATNQPLWGLLHWNTNYFNFNLISFQMNVIIGIHQMVHLLGFSNILYNNYKHGKLVTNRKGSYIDGQFMRKAIKQQFGCQGADGMLLESNGGLGTANSHWSYKAAFNEFMTASVLLNNPTISYLTLALLQETGWYRRIYKTYGNFLNWGYQKGCSILDPFDCQSDQYCHSDRTMMCDYDQTALGICKNQTLNPSCLMIKYYSNYICIDPNFQANSLNKDIIDATGEKGGQNSKCFNSNLHKDGSSPSKYAFRCYQTLCSQKSRTLTVKIGQNFGLCIFPRQNITVKGYQGYLTCPSSFIRSCAVKRCPKQCNANGLCIKGVCMCSQKYSGQSCSDITAQGFASKITTTIASQNNNCQLGSYLTTFGDCQSCSIDCVKCSQKGCQLCVGNRLPGQDGC